MKSAFLVTNDDQFFTRACAAIASWDVPSEFGPGWVRIDAVGIGSLLIEPADLSVDWEWRGVAGHDTAGCRLHAFLVSCRDNALFCSAARGLRESLQVDLWVVDDSDQLVDVADLSPERIHL